jgi:hypothetical protein
MFCTVCESEYQAGVTVCPDDGSELVDRLTADNTVHDHSEARFLRLHTFGSPAEAEMVQDLLVKNGIHAAVQSGGYDALSPLLSTVAPGASVLVDELDYDRALEIYRAYFGEDTTPLTGTTLEEDLENEATDTET